MSPSVGSCLSKCYAWTLARRVEFLNYDSHVEFPRFPYFFERRVLQDVQSFLGAAALPLKTRC